MRLPKHRALQLIILSFIAIFNTSMTSDYDPYKILTTENIIMMNMQIEPAITSTLGSIPFLEFYREWQCLDATQIEIRCIDHELDRPPFEIPSDERDQLSYVVNLRTFETGPLIDMDFGHHDYTFDLLECSAIVQQWQQLLESDEGLCVYATPWPETPDTDEYAYYEITGIKNRKGHFFLPGYLE